MATLNLQVGAGTDDARNNGSTFPGTGNYSATGTYNNIGVGSDGVFHMVGARFLNLTIPQGAIINAADIQVCAQAATSTQCDWTIAAEDVDNAATFSSGHQPKDAYNSRTSATADWNIGTASWTAGSWHTSSDIAAVIQEIINRPGWVSGNALNVVVYNTDNTVPPSNRYRVIRMWDYSGNLSGMKLDITYTVGGKLPVMMRGYRARRVG